MCELLKSVQAKVLTFDLFQGKFGSHTRFLYVEMEVFILLCWAQIDLFLFPVLFSF